MGTPKTWAGERDRSKDKSATTGRREGRAAKLRGAQIWENPHVSTAAAGGWRAGWRDVLGPVPADPAGAVLAPRRRRRA